MSPQTIGFFASLLAHLGIFALLFSFANPASNPPPAPQNIVLNLTNIMGTSAASGAQQKAPQTTPPPLKPPPQPKQKPKNPPPSPVAAPKDSPPVDAQDSQTSQDSVDSADSPDSTALDSSAEAFGGVAIANLDSQSEFYALIKSAIERHNKYPKMARQRGIEGAVEVEFLLSLEGQISAIKILNAPHALLSQAAISALKRAAEDFPPLKNAVRIRLRIDYGLI